MTDYEQALATILKLGTTESVALLVKRGGRIMQSQINAKGVTPMHIVSDKSLQRPGYIYDDESGVGYPDGMKHSINWKHIDGPLMYHSDGGLHWLTFRERLALWLGFTDEISIDRKYRRDRRK